MAEARKRFKCPFWATCTVSPDGKNVIIDGDCPRRNPTDPTKGTCRRPELLPKRIVTPHKPDDNLDQIGNGAQDIFRQACDIAGS